MSEPTRKATSTKEILPGFLWWHIQDNRIGDFESDSFAIVQPDRTILIDPLPLEDDGLKTLSNVTDILLTGSCHQRSAWRYRKQFGAKVHAPENGVGFDEKPDSFYKDGDELPGNITAVHAPGPAVAHYAFLSKPGAGVLFCADILVNREGTVAFVPAEYQEDFAKTQESARNFLTLSFDAICFAHGNPIVKEAAKALKTIF